MQFYPIGMQSFVARRLERVITSSEASGRQITSDFGVAPERLAMLGNGLDTELFRPDPSVPRAERRLLCVGRASDPNKGIRTLVDALARLPDDVTLTLVDSPTSEARKWALERGCADRLELAGRVSTEELVRLYRSATLVVVPSRYEGFGLPAAEAMACGTPVVTTDAGALPEVVSVGGGGVLVPPDDPDAMAKAIRDLLDHPELRADLGRRARPRIDEAFAWPRIAERTAEVYHEVIAERRAGRLAA